MDDFEFDVWEFYKEWAKDMGVPLSKILPDTLKKCKTGAGALVPIKKN